jgi:uncharacterized protein YjbI with pentapeptide repeats
MRYWQAWIACGLLMSLPAAAQADIFRWDNGQLIPGTEGITPGPWVDLSSPMGEWSSPARNLHFADFSGGLDLTQAFFFGSWLDHSRFNGANLTGADLLAASLTNADLSGANLTNARLGYVGYDCYTCAAILTNANFAGAVITGTQFSDTTSRGFTKEQLYSTASYQQKNLWGIVLSSNNLTGWDFSGQDFSGAVFYDATLTNANLAGAMVAGAKFGGGSSGFTKEQLYSTASYQQRYLRDIELFEVDLTGGDFSGHDLTGAVFFSSTLTNVNFAGAVVAGANFQATTSQGFTKEQLYSTASYQQRNLRGIGLADNDLTGWDFSAQDLTGAGFYQSFLTNANFAGAMVTGADFVRTWGSFTKEQLYSTASYQQRNLGGIGLVYNDLTGWDFSGQDLIGAVFTSSTLTNANLSGANLTDAVLWFSTLTNANLAGAIVTGANLGGTTSQRFTKEQLYSTASYQQRNLRGIGLSYNDLTGWDFSGQDLAGADFALSTLTNANFSFADLRGAQMPSEPIQLARNTIREGGAINGLELAAGETLVVRDSNFGITVNDRMNAVSGGTLELVLGDADWGSTMSVVIMPDLGGTLRVRFADQANLAPLLGTTFDFFDWPGVLETNNRFDAIELPPGTQWDLNQLYVTGTAQLTFIPVPTGDFNRDGTVDAADYVVWRNGLGTTYTQADYDAWRANFGQTAGGGEALPSAERLPAIPEPSTALVMFVGGLALAARCRAIRNASTRFVDNGNRRTLRPPTLN